MSAYRVTRRAVCNKRGTCGWEYTAWAWLADGEESSHAILSLEEGGRWVVVGTDHGSPVSWEERQGKAHRVILTAYPELARKDLEMRGVMLYQEDEEVKQLFAARDAARKALDEAEHTLRMPRERRVEEKD